MIAAAFTRAAQMEWRSGAQEVHSRRSLRFLVSGKTTYRDVHWATCIAYLLTCGQRRSHELLFREAGREFERNVRLRRAKALAIAFRRRQQFLVATRAHGINGTSRSNFCVKTKHSTFFFRHPGSLVYQQSRPILSATRARYCCGVQGVGLGDQCKYVKALGTNLREHSQGKVPLDFSCARHLSRLLGFLHDACALGILQHVHMYVFELLISTMFLSGSSGH